MGLDWGKLVESAVVSAADTAKTYVDAEIAHQESIGSDREQAMQHLVEARSVEAQTAADQIDYAIQEWDRAIQEQTRQDALDVRAERDQQRQRLYTQSVRWVNDGLFDVAGEETEQQNERRKKATLAIGFALETGDWSGVFSLIPDGDANRKRAAINAAIDAIVGDLPKEKQEGARSMLRGFAVDGELTPKEVEAATGGGGSSAMGEGASKAEERYGEMVRSGELGILTKDQTTDGLNIARSMGTDQAIKNLDRAKRSFTFIKSARTAPAGGADDPTSELSLIYAFVRAIDPESVVREGEVALFMQGRGWGPRAAEGFKKMATEGSLLTDNEKANIYRFAEDLQEFYTGEEARLEKHYLARFKFAGIDENRARPLLRDVGIGDVDMKPKNTGLTTGDKNPKALPTSVGKSKVVPKSGSGGKTPPAKKDSTGGDSGSSEGYKSVTLADDFTVDFPIDDWAKEAAAGRGNYKTDNEFREALHGVIMKILEEHATDEMNELSKKKFGVEMHRSENVIWKLVNEVTAAMKGAK